MKRLMSYLLLLFRKRLRQSAFVRALYYDYGIADLMVFVGVGDFERKLDKALAQFLTKEEREGKDTVRRIKKDIKRCFYKYKTTPSEYFLFKFRNKSAQERSTYLSDSVVMNTVAKTISRRKHDDELENKFNFYQLNKPFFLRDAVLIKGEEDYQSFCEMARKHHLIAKPNFGSAGSRILAFHIQNDLECEEAWKKIIQKKGEWIVEEYILQSKEMAVWNESSVNTIRINSFLHRDEFTILCPFIRTGRNGSIVDNAGQGGIFASIDKETGKISTVGMDEYEHEYNKHPDSGIQFVGWQVPHWAELLKISEATHRNMSDHIYISWDFALSENGWVLIEGNWGEFVVQQLTLKKGFKEEFMRSINN